MSKNAAAAAAAAAATPVSGDVKRTVIEFFEDWGVVPSIEPEYKAKGAFSKLVGGVLKVISTSSGNISCILSVTSPVLNGIGRMHGAGVAAVSERVAIGCARTVVGEETDLFLGDLSISYLSSAPRNAEVVVNGRVVKSGKNLTIVDVNFHDQESGKLVYSSRATLYNTPLSTL